MNKHQLLSLYDSVAAERVLSLDAVDGSPLFSVLINCQQILHFPHNNQLNLEPTLSLPRMHEEREREREREREELPKLTEANNRIVQKLNFWKWRKVWSLRLLKKPDTVLPVMLSDELSGSKSSSFLSLSPDNRAVCKKKYTIP